MQLSKALKGHSRRMLFITRLQEEEKKAGCIAQSKGQAYAYKDKVKTAMEALREPVDELEMLVDKEVWPYPTYADLMFEV